MVDGYFGPKNINAARAKRDPDSLWNFIAAQPASVTAKVLSPEDPREAFGGAILLDLLDGGIVPLTDDGGFELQLERYGYRWFRIQRPTDRRI